MTVTQLDLDLPNFRPEGQFFGLGASFFDLVEPADFPKTTLRYRNDPLAHSLGLAPLSDHHWVSAFGHFTPLPGVGPHRMAMRYHGHQFRHYNPDLGDGRGFLFAQAREAPSSRLIDLAAKGSGQTPWSRQGDGRLTLKGAVRELLATTLLAARGVNTSRTLSIIETHESLSRGDEPSPTRSAVLVRASQSHIRFGTFERLAYFEDYSQMAALIEHVLTLYYPHVVAKDLPQKALAMFEAVVISTAKTLAQWMAAGFVHGVLNTDNMNITGESFDYGPWRVLPAYLPGFTAAYFDHTGLYAFGRQPEAVHWNLYQLAKCLAAVADPEVLTRHLSQFGDLYQRAFAQAFCQRLGIVSFGFQADLDLARQALALMRERAEAETPLAWEGFFFDGFGGKCRVDKAQEGPNARHYACELGQEVFAQLAEREPLLTARPDHPYFQADAPQDLLIERVEALWAPIAEADDFSPLMRVIGDLTDLYGVLVPDPPMG